MQLTKIVVLVAHDDNLSVEKLSCDVDYAIGQALEEARMPNVFYEVRNYGTKEVTLGSIDYSLEEGFPLEEATPADEPVAP